jgi:hypothetical protein
MEDSSLKVEVAEQEMRKAVQSMREEQHALGLKAGMRQRSLIDMHDLIHGLREEQQQAKAALHACQMALCVARGVATLHQAFGWERHCLGRALRCWLRSVHALSTAFLDAEIRGLEETANLQNHGELDRGLRGTSRVIAVHSRRAQLVEDAEVARERQIGELRTEHQLQVWSVKPVVRKAVF